MTEPIQQEYKSGYVAIIGRPNVGKSTLLNTILKHKVSATSPKPQTTRQPVQAVYEDSRGQIIFIDTPGVFGKALDPVSKRINPKTEGVLKGGVDVIVYLIDHTKDRDSEENKVLGIARQIQRPKILAINKSDIKKPDFYAHYKFMEEDFKETIHISAMYRSNLNYLVDAIFEYLPVGEKLVDTENLPTPLLNMNSKMFIAEIIREKAYIFLRKEVPYTLTAVVDEIDKRKDGVMFISGRILTSADRYKKMIIGDKGRMIKEIGQAVRKELETATNQKIYIELTVETNTHWYQESL